MSKSVHPYAHRLGILRDWRSRWIAKDSKYRANLRADTLVREYLERKLRGNYVNAIEIERGQNSMRLVIQTSRPGMIIGRQGEGAIKLKSDLVKQINKWGMTVPSDFKIDIEEVKSPESHASIVAQMAAESLEKRFAFRRVLKQTIEKVMANKNVEGVRITMSGRLGGADMGRTETLMRGKLPLQTLRADVDFARARAKLSYGIIGIKVWIYKGEILPGGKS